MATPSNSASLPEYEKLRQQARQRATAQGQQATSAIQRRLAAIGGLSGGAGIKLEQQARQEAARAGEEAITGLTLAEQQELRRRQEIQEGREFTAGQAEKQRQFISGESAAQRAFAEKEAGVQRGFAAEQANLQRNFQAAENALGRALTKEEAQKVRDFTAEQAGIQREFAAGQSELQRGFVAQESALEREQRKELAAKQLDLAQQQLDLEKDVAAFNKEIAKWQQNQPTDILGSLLGPAFSLSNIPGLGEGGNVFGSLARSGIGGVLGGSVGGVVGGAISKFCFCEGTMVDTVTGVKDVKDIEVGDVLSDGSVVYSKGVALSDDIYDYNGIKVTGSHAVLHNREVWARVENTGAKKLDLEEKVYFLSNTSHKLYIEDMIFADYDEIDDAHLYNDEQILELLNEKIRREV